MKYIIILVSMLVLIGCNGDYLDEPKSFIVREFESTGSKENLGMCKYHFYVTYAFGTQDPTNYAVRDTCGKYAVGDTIFTRKQ